MWSYPGLSPLGLKFRWTRADRQGMRDATYFDSSGSMETVDSQVLAQHAGDPLFYFDGAVYDEKPPCGGPTDFDAVFRHARLKGFKSISIVTDGYGPGYGIQPYRLQIEWIKI